jgi:RHS repeat-associated protein
VLTRREYDLLNQTTAVVDGLGRRTEFDYDANGNLTSLADPAGHTTSYAHDPLDRVTSRTDPLEETTGYGYDGNGNLVSVTAPSGTVTELAYDALDRLAFTGFGKTGPGTYESTVGYGYDTVGRLATITDSAAGAATFSYDAFDQVTTVTTPDGTTSYTYDTAGRRTGMTVAGLPQVAYGYDAADRLTSVIQGSVSATMSWDDADRLTTLSLPNQVVAAYSYDENDRPVGIAWTGSGNPLGDLTYGYDSRGLPVAVGGSLAAVDLPDQVTTTAYDAANRLTGWNGTTLAYDDDGRLTSDGTRSFTWDARGQLSAVTTPSGTVAYDYDPLGRRRSVDDGAQVIGFLHDGANPVATTDATGTPTGRWLAGLGLDSTLAITDAAGNTRTLLTDALGSTVGEVDPAGGLSAGYTYTPHGQATTTGSPTSAVTYTGREADPTGLVYLRARYYDPKLGRFISPDPIGFAGGDTNLYAYAFNNPVTYTDPTGLTPLALIGCAVGAAIGGGHAYLSGRKSGWGIAGAAVGGCLTGATLGGLGGLAIRAATRLAARSATGTLKTATAGPRALPIGPWGQKIVDARAKLPNSWGPGTPNTKGVGTRWFDPANKGNGIRIDQGIPGSSFPSQQVDHVVVRSGGRILGPDGKPIVGSLSENPQAHIPLSDWLTWSSWGAP